MSKKRYSTISKIEYKYSMDTLGMSVYNRRSMYRSILGISCIGLGVMTIFCSTALVKMVRGSVTRVVHIQLLPSRSYWNVCSIEAMLTV